MSRSNPHASGLVNPAKRVFEWNSENGGVRYYDKDAKKQVELGSDFSFVLLDQLGSVRGWHDASSSGIYSNEVRDTRAEILLVKAFKGGQLAQGVYKDIKDRVAASGGKFVSNCYIAYKGDNGEFELGVLRFKGAGLQSWMEFTKANRADLYKKGVKITGAVDCKKGRIVYKTPTLKLVDLSEATNDAAIALDVELQEFLETYLNQNKRVQTDVAATHVRDEDADYNEPEPPAVDDDDIPF